MFDSDCVIIGAGVVGLAVARALARAERDCIIIDKGPVIGSGTSSRNSEVIHAGLYYPTQSIKARACVAGKARLYDYLERHGLPYKRLGKLVVATQHSEVARLDDIRAQAESNGVPDTELLDAGQVHALESDIACAGALLSPSTGIVDSHSYMLSLLGEAEDHGAMLALNTVVERVVAGARGFEVHARDRQGVTKVRTRELVNSAGLEAAAVAAATEGLGREHVPKLFYVKGSYFSLAAKPPFSRLIYPVPVAHGLGVHLTLDIAGQARFGPDTEVVDEVDYDVGPERRDAFEKAIRRYWPGLPAGALYPDYAGIRPKLTLDGASDFRMDGPREHGVAGLVNLFGIESPGLTASLWLAERARELLSV